jgi:hypothetical protein
MARFEETKMVITTFWRLRRRRRPFIMSVSCRREAESLREIIIELYVLCVDFW